MASSFSRPEDRIPPPIPRAKKMIYNMPVRTYVDASIIARLPKNVQKCPLFPAPVTVIPPPPRPRTEEASENDNDDEFAQKSEIRFEAIKVWLKEKQHIEEANRKRQEGREKKLNEWVSWRERYEAEEDKMINEFFEQEAKRREAETKEKKRQETQRRVAEVADSNGDVSRDKKGTEVKPKKRVLATDSNEGGSIKKAKISLPPIASDALPEEIEGRMYSRVEDGSECDSCTKLQYACWMPLDNKGKKFVYRACKSCTDLDTKCTYGGVQLTDKRKPVPMDIIEIDDDDAGTNEKEKRRSSTVMTLRSGTRTGSQDLGSFIESISETMKTIGNDVRQQCGELNGMKATITTISTDITGLRESVDHLSSVVTALIVELHRTQTKVSMRKDPRSLSEKPRPNSAVAGHRRKEQDKEKREEQEQQEEKEVQDEVAASSDKSEMLVDYGSVSGED
ncbi:hypothetical protein VNI00_008943 [Paramarasmius palmivorus]|uniref:Uncharacterized protein n=1 Tax=Paramarasmius palmivorus TaxID=297713 RepID=A0AAW0CTV3_9AGAR